MWLDRYITFGANRIYKKYTPTYYICTNPLVIKQNRDEIEMLPCKKFIREGMTNTGIPLRIDSTKKFSYIPYQYVYEGYTVTFVSLQLAYYFGFTVVLLVGVDHEYKFDGKPNEQKLMSEDDPNHFDPEYFKGQLWNNPDLEQSEYSYGLAKKAYEEDGRRIINLTRDSKLDVFEKDNFENWI